MKYDCLCGSKVCNRSIFCISLMVESDDMTFQNHKEFHRNTQSRNTSLQLHLFDSIEALGSLTLQPNRKMDIISTTCILALAGFLCFKISASRPRKNPQVSPSPLAWAGLRKEAFPKLRAFMRQHYAGLQTITDGYNDVATSVGYWKNFN